LRGIWSTSLDYQFAAKVGHLDHKTNVAPMPTASEFGSRHAQY
jgi:hypothetical protein